MLQNNKSLHCSQLCSYSDKVLSNNIIKTVLLPWLMCELSLADLLSFFQHWFSETTQTVHLCQSVLCAYNKFIFFIKAERTELACINNKISDIQMPRHWKKIMRKNEHKDLIYESFFDEEMWNRKNRKNHEIIHKDLVTNEEMILKRKLHTALGNRL